MKINKNIIVFFVVSFSIILSILIYLNYEKNYPYFHDVSSYNFINILVSKYTEQFGVVASLQNEFFNNNRNFLRTIPFIFFPTLSTFKLSNLITTLPFLFILIYKINIFICDKINNNKIKWFLTFFILLIPGIYNPVIGIVINWVDLNAAVIISISSIYLFEWIMVKKKKSFIYFLIFSYFSIYSRFS